MAVRAPLSFKVELRVQGPSKRVPVRGWLRKFASADQQVGADPVIHSLVFALVERALHARSRS